MKKIFNLLLSAVAVIGITTSCSDVPAPYDINQGGEISFGKVMPYKSASLSTGWTTNKLSENEPWSQGSSYTQATGYQDWDGTGKKNAEVEGYLISPALNTKSESGKAKFSFDYTIKYTNNVSDWQSRHKILISKNYDGKEFKPEQWEELNWVGTASPYSDWTLYSSGDIQIPEAYTNKDSIYVAFHFSAPASSSTTWELMNFLIQEGEADNTDGPAPGGDSSKEAPYTVAEAKAATGTGYVKGYIVGYIDGQKLEEGAKFEVPAAAETEILIADDPNETNASNTFPVQLPAGDIRSALELSAHPDYLKKEVILYGSIETYFGVPGLKATSWASIGGKEFGKDPESVETPGTPEGNGTLDTPYNVAGVIAYINTLGADKESDKAVYIKGKVNANNTTAATITQYGNMTFTIVDEGNSTTFTAFQVYAPGNVKFTAVDQIKVGDEVVVYGKVVNYMGNKPETVGKGQAYVVSINGKSEEGGNTGGNEGDAQHITIAKFLELADPNTTYELTGTVKNIKNTTYGNFDLVDETGSVYIYGLLDLEGKSKNFASLNITEGDEVTLKGKYKDYNGTAEIADAQFISVKKGDGGNTTPDDGGNTGGDNTGASTLENGDFESWVSSTEPTGWKSASTASNAKLSQSTTAHGGKYAVEVEGNETSNKRLASQEITLEAGTYTFSFYAKAKEAGKSQVRPGYVPVTDGKVGSYMYGDYATLNNDEWTLVTYEFTLNAKSTICLVIMNPKKSDYSDGKPALIDDATLTKK